MDISFVFVFSVVCSHSHSLTYAWMVPGLCLAVSPPSTRGPLGLWKTSPGCFCHTPAAPAERLPHCVWRVSIAWLSGLYSP